MKEISPGLKAGVRLTGEPLAMTRERMRWYCDALETAAAASGEFIVAEPTIHSDDAYAESQGLSGIIADGMLSTNYISSLLVRHFGIHYLARGSLRTKYIRPIYEDEVVEPYIEVREIRHETTGTLFLLNVGCTADATLCTVGEATILAQEAAETIS